MRQPRRPKPSATDEVARVLRIYDMLVDELRTRGAPVDVTYWVTQPPNPPYPPLPAAALTVAEHIAARTED